MIADLVRSATLAIESIFGGVLGAFGPPASNYDPTAFHAARIIARMGLSMTDGSPTFDLGSPLGGEHPRVCIHALGAPHGTPLRFAFFREATMLTGHHRNVADCRFDAAAASAFPPFEAFTLVTPLGGITHSLPLPSAVTGNPTIDGAFYVATHEPAMATLLGELLPTFVNFAAGGIHLVGDGKTISFRMAVDRSPFMPNVVHYAEELSARMSYLAMRIGG